MYAGVRGLLVITMVCGVGAMCRYDQSSCEKKVILDAQMLGTLLPSNGTTGPVSQRLLVRKLPHPAGLVEG